MRLFIAIRLTEKMKDAVSGLIRDMKRCGAVGNYTIPDNMHITLAFIGETNRLGDINSALSEVRFSPFELKLGKFGSFGNLYWVGLDDQPLLDQLAHNVREALDRHDIPYDRKKFKAHITVARKVESREPIHVTAPEVGMEVNAVSLMKSERVNGRIKYTEIGVFNANQKI